AATQQGKGHAVSSEARRIQGRPVRPVQATALGPAPPRCHDARSKALTEATMARRGFLMLAAALALLATPRPGPAQPPATGTLRVVLINPLASLDPVVSTAAFVRNHGFFVYDQLFGLDAQGNAQPQMVDRHEVSADGRTHRFTLRDGLAFHDGQ